jgi:hypothetical protein
MHEKIIVEEKVGNQNLTRNNSTWNFNANGYLNNQIELISFGLAKLWMKIL